MNASTNAPAATAQASGRDASLTFARSSDLDILVSVKICDLIGQRPRPPLSTLDASARHAGLQLHPTLSDLYVVCQVWSDNKPLSIPFRTAHKAFKSTYLSAHLCALGCTRMLSTMIDGTKRSPCLLNTKTCRSTRRSLSLCTTAKARLLLPVQLQ